MRKTFAEQLYELAERNLRAQVEGQAAAEAPEQDRTEPRTYGTDVESGVFVVEGTEAR